MEELQYKIRPGKGKQGGLIPHRAPCGERRSASINAKCVGCDDQGVGMSHGGFVIEVGPKEWDVDIRPGWGA